MAPVAVAFTAAVAVFEAWAEAKQYASADGDD